MPSKLHNTPLKQTDPPRQTGNWVRKDRAAPARSLTERYMDMRPARFPRCGLRSAL